MSKYELIKGSCADQEVDAVVNAANRLLEAGGGICGVIFSKAGYGPLENECSRINTPLEDGDAVLTPSFGLKNAKSIIHAVGPILEKDDSTDNELLSAYYNSLVVLMDNGYHSISFPLISSGIFGRLSENPVKKSCEQFLNAYNEFVENYPNYDVDILVCAFTDDEYEEASKVLNPKMKIR